MTKEQMDRLVHEEGLDDLERLLTPREWDEVPLVSRLARISFLADLDVREKSRILVVSAVAYLDRILAFANARNREDVVVMVSVLNWDDLDATEPESVRPKFWICTNVERDLSAFRLRPAASKEGSMVTAWLRSADLLGSHEVFDLAEADTEPELRRVYISQREIPRVERFVLR